MIVGRVWAEFGVNLRLSKELLQLSFDELKLGSFVAGYSFDESLSILLLNRHSRSTIIVQPVPS